MKYQWSILPALLAVATSAEAQEAGAAPATRVEARTTRVTVINNPAQAPPLPGQARPPAAPPGKSGQPGASGQAAGASPTGGAPTATGAPPRREGELLRPRAQPDRPAARVEVEREGRARSDAKADNKTEAAAERRQDLREVRERRRELREDRAERQADRLRRLLQER